ncbi:MAG: peptidylprolyl isomerase [Saprospiraceae bacterium]
MIRLNFLRPERTAILLLITVLLSCNQAKKSQEFVIQTSFGNMTVRLYDSTPKHRDNFIKLVKQGYYKDLLFHRVMPGFMIQGGDPDSRTAAAGQHLGAGGPGYTIDAEIGKYHFKGALAAARLGDQANPQKKSSGSQFYIVQGQRMDPVQLQAMSSRSGINYTQADIQRYSTEGGAPFLDGAYTVFGEVTMGLDVIDKIAAVPCDAMNRPQSDVRMNIVAK